MDRVESDQRRHTWILLGRGNRIDSAGGLGAGKNGNRRDHIGRGEWRRRTGRDDWKRGHFGVR